MRKASEAARDHFSQSGDSELVRQALLTGLASPENDLAQDAYCRILRAGIPNPKDWVLLQVVLESKGQ